MPVGVHSGESGVDGVNQPDTGETAAEYRPHLDGLRAVAVYLVVLFHAGSDRFPGGYIGVDVFFVLSGFLVTRLLLRDIARLGSIRFGRFYSRRFRRLLPAAFVVLIVTAVVYTAIASPVAVAGARSSFKAAFLYSTNWYFIHQATGYFGAVITASPVLHFWSLAVEEQFYLVWPLALGAAFALTRRLESTRQVRVIRITVAVCALASVVWALSLRSSDPNRAYYGTDTRANELLAGAFVALTPALVGFARGFRRAIGPVSVFGAGALIVMASSLVNYDAIVRGVAVTVATCVLIVAIEAADGGLVKRALSTPLMVYLGKISYGTYLWHWLVIVVIHETFHISTIATIGITCLVASSIASLSFEVLERPIRFSRLLDRHRFAVISAGLTVSVVSALVFIPAIVDSADAARSVVRTPTVVGSTPIPAGLDLQDARSTRPFPDCFGKSPRACTLVKGSGPSVMLIGDSHAWMLIPLFTAIAKLENLTLSVSVRGGCPWQRGLYTPLKLRLCESQKEDLYERVIPALKPDVVVAMNLGYGTKGLYPAPMEDAHARKADEATVAQLTRSSVTALRAHGRKLLVIEPIPLPRLPNFAFDPLDCLSKATAIETCRYQAWPGLLPVERVYRAIAKDDPGVHSLDLDKAVCPFAPMCDPVVNGQFVKWDQSHLTEQFVRTLVPEVDLYLRRSGIIPREPLARRGTGGAFAGP
jgi:peptidoglycan/LPS O-acetylase OafA/YrhL